MLHIYVKVNLAIIGSNNGLTPVHCQAIIWTNAGLLLSRPWETNFSEIWVKIWQFSYKKIWLKMWSAKWRPFCLSPDVFAWIFVVICLGLPIRIEKYDHNKKLGTLSHCYLYHDIHRFSLLKLQLDKVGMKLKFARIFHLFCQYFIDTHPCTMFSSYHWQWFGAHFTSLLYKTCKMPFVPIYNLKKHVPNTILCISWQLRYGDMCKIVTWLDHSNLISSKTKLFISWLV